MFKMEIDLKALWMRRTDSDTSVWNVHRKSPPLNKATAIGKIYQNTTEPTLFAPYDGIALSVEELTELAAVLTLLEGKES